jgi:hypothetical protein
VAITIDYVADWAARLRSRLYTQFRNKVTWEKWITEVLAPQFQDLEDSGQSLLGLNDIDASEGAQLDIIGRKVGQLRASLDDATYRTVLRARVAANSSSGGAEEIYGVLRALLGQSIGLVLTFSPIKSFTLRVRSAITATQVTHALSFLRDSKEATTRAILEWKEQAAEDTFCTEGGEGKGFPVFTAASGASAASDEELSVLSTAAFSSSGFIVVDQGTALEETLAYTVGGATVFTLELGSGLPLYTHEAGASVVELGSGGKLAGARQA